jgi:hypothetical protein
VIAPTFWKEVPEEMEQVLAAASKLKGCLHATGLDVWIDQGAFLLHTRPEFSY